MRQLLRISHETKLLNRNAVLMQGVLDRVEDEGTLCSRHDIESNSPWHRTITVAGWQWHLFKRLQRFHDVTGKRPAVIMMKREAPLAKDGTGSRQMTQATGRWLSWDLDHILRIVTQQQGGLAIGGKGRCHHGADFSRLASKARLQMQDLKQSLRDLKMQVPCLTEPATKRPDLRHPIAAIQTANGSKELLTSSLEALSDDFSPHIDAFQTEIRWLVSQTQPALYQLSQIGRVGREDTGS